MPLILGSHHHSLSPLKYALAKEKKKQIFNQSTQFHRLCRYLKYVLFDKVFGRLEDRKNGRMEEWKIADKGKHACQWLRCNVWL